jgi:hypothetical protein
MQQQWDERVSKCLASADEQLNTADMLDSVGRGPGRWLGVFWLNERATMYRAGAANDQAIADRMATCPHNPHNGGAGFKPAPRFWEVFTPSDVAWTLLLVGYTLIAGAAVMGGVMILAVSRHHYDPNSPEYLGVTLAAVAAGVWSAMVFQWAVQGAAQVAGLTARYVWGPR